MPIPVFQGLDQNVPAFGVAFQGRTRQPVFFDPYASARILWEVSVPLQVHEQGDTVYIQVKVRDGRTVPAQLFNPDTSVVLDLVNPSGSTIVDGASMTNEALGIYSYTYEIPGAAAVGTWTAIFQAENGGYSSVSLPLAVFVVQ